jgi:hypothetical protein
MQIEDFERSIEEALFELPFGPITIGEILHRPELWQLLRDEITDRINSDPNRPLAVCRECGGSVLIAVRARGDNRYPYFAHRSADQRPCIWHSDPRLRLNDARALQYGGAQESPLHEYLCDLVASLVARDLRATTPEVDEYKKLLFGKHGRYPDVYFQLSKFGEFALEIQLSRPFAKEVSSRHLYYKEAGVSLIWIFYNIDPTTQKDLPQGFRDAIARQRGNMFVIDSETISKSCDQKTLVLKCFLQNGKNSFDQPKLCILDDLTYPTKGAPFLEDRILPQLVGPAEALRAIWLSELEAAADKKRYEKFVGPAFDAVWKETLVRVPALAELTRQSASKKFGTESGARASYSELVGLLLSIVATGIHGAEVQFILNFKGKRQLLETLNAVLSRERYGRLAYIIAFALQNSASASLLGEPSLQKIIAKAKDHHPNQFLEGSPIWQAVECFLPECFDRLVRAQLEVLSALPVWATPPNMSLAVSETKSTT